MTKNKNILDMVREQIDVQLRIMCKEMDRLLYVRRRIDALITARMKAKHPELVVDNNAEV